MIFFERFHLNNLPNPISTKTTIFEKQTLSKWIFKQQNWNQCNFFLTEEESILKKIQDLFKDKDLNKEANLEIPEWQIKETLKRQKQLKDYPALAENFDVVMERLKTKYEL